MEPVSSRVLRSSTGRGRKSDALPFLSTTAIDARVVVSMISRGSPSWHQARGLRALPIEGDQPVQFFSLTGEKSRRCAAQEVVFTTGRCKDYQRGGIWRRRPWHCIPLHGLAAIGPATRPIIYRSDSVFPACVSIPPVHAIFSSRRSMPPLV